MQLIKNFIKGGSRFLTARSMSYQKVVLIGNVGKDPLFKPFENQAEAESAEEGVESGSEKKGVYRFPVATSKNVKKADGSYNQMTTWHQLSTMNHAYGNKVKAGDRVLVEGEIKNWQNENSHGSSIMVLKLVLLSSKAFKEAAVEGATGVEA